MTARGHIRQRGKNSWEINISLGKDTKTGKYRYHRETVRGLKRDAERKRTEILRHLDMGTLSDSSSVTLGDFLNQWLETYAETGVRPRTLQGYQDIVRNHLTRRLGSLQVSRLRPSNLQDYYSWALREGRMDGKGGLSAQTVLHHHRVLSEALTHAVRWGIVPRNVADAVSPPRPSNPEIRVLQPDEVGKLLDAARETPYYPIIHTALYTGMRRSELLGLRWEDVDLIGATVSVRRVMHVLKGSRVVFQEPKTSASQRLVDLAPPSVLMLHEHLAKSQRDAGLLEQPWRDTRPLFARLNGEPILPNTLTHAFIKLIRKTNLDGVRFHDLRHTHASLMLKEGVHPKVVQERLGHSTISVTLDIYSHVAPGIQRAAATRFADALEPQQARSEASISR